MVAAYIYDRMGIAVKIGLYSSSHRKEMLIDKGEELPFEVMHKRTINVNSLRYPFALGYTVLATAVKPNPGLET